MIEVSQGTYMCEGDTEFGVLLDSMHQVYQSYHTGHVYGTCAVHTVA